MLLDEVYDTCVKFGGNLHTSIATTVKEDTQLANPKMLQDFKRFQLKSFMSQGMLSRLVNDATNLKLSSKFLKLIQEESKKGKSQGLANVEQTKSHKLKIAIQELNIRAKLVRHP